MYRDIGKEIPFNVKILEAPMSLEIKTLKPVF
jgi:hypothetical protein